MKMWIWWHTSLPFLRLCLPLSFHLHIRLSRMYWVEYWNWPEQTWVYRRGWGCRPGPEVNGYCDFLMQGMSQCRCRLDLQVVLLPLEYNIQHQKWTVNTVNYTYSYWGYKVSPYYHHYWGHPWGDWGSCPSHPGDTQVHLSPENCTMVHDMYVLGRGLSVVAPKSQAVFQLDHLSLFLMK